MTTPDIAGLCERLRAVESSRKFGVTTAATTIWHRNPEGPEAADTLERQAAEIERLRGAITVAAVELQLAGGWLREAGAYGPRVTATLDASNNARAALTGEDTCLTHGTPN
jgi:hypothetical protein